MDRYLPRLADDRLRQLLQSYPAVMVTGVRACGKTTTAARLAASDMRLDQAQTARAVEADPDVLLRSMREPLLIDEWQMVPDILGAIKRAVDTNPERGRFLVTGSTAGSSRSPQWQATGRMVDIIMRPLTVRELRGRLDGSGLHQRLLLGADGFPSGDGPEDLGDYLDLALQGGFPEVALRLSGRERHEWLEGYARRLVTRDATEIDRVRDPLALGRFLQAVCLNSAGVVHDSTLAAASGVAGATARAYDSVLRNALVEDALPAWFSNRLARLTKAPKRYVVDASLMCAVLGATKDTILRDADLLGRVIETFVLAQLRVEADLAPMSPRLYHVRTQDARHEVDCVIEYDAFRVAGVEVKAKAAPVKSDARHLMWMKEQLGDRFVGGVVLHTGRFTFPLADGIVAAPISTLWR